MMRVDDLLLLADHWGQSLTDLLDRMPAIAARGTIIVPETTRKRAPKRPKNPAKKRSKKRK